MKRFVLSAIEILILSVLILAPRVANYENVFVRGNIYFTDADCYARMTRARMCADHPGLIVRHHDFENFPQGTNPHTTAPFDYMIVALSNLLNPFSAQSIDLAGAIVSPLLALIGGWFLWWWLRTSTFRYRWILLILYAISPVLVHGTELGRPDHQSLVIVLVAIGVCAEWTLQTVPSRGWSVASGIAWSLAFWVSLYEPLILFGLIVVGTLTKDRHLLFGSHRRSGWILFAVLIAISLLVECRLPSRSIFQSGALLQNWSRTVGELAHVPPLNRIWFVWAGYMIAIAPILIWICLRKKVGPPRFLLVLLVATFLLTIWQARWSYFFVLMVAITLPSLLAPVETRAAVWTAFTVSIFPILQFWDAQLWPGENELARRIEHRNESVELRELASAIHSEQKQPFLAPWWLSPSIAYWSEQPGVAGSSHEALAGTADTARFFLTDDPQAARELLVRRRAEWVFAYDSDRVTRNSTELLGIRAPQRPFGQILDRTPGQVPAYLVLSGQNGAARLFRFVDKL